MERHDTMNEHQIYLNMINQNLKSTGGFFIDIGASDGITISNSYHLANDNNWRGISIEYDSNKFKSLLRTQARSEIIKLNELITVNNIIGILKNNDVPKEINFITIDIDGYDYHILKQILNNYSCQTIMVEINEKIPHPIEFTVDYTEDYFWQGDHFYGMSLTKFYTLCKEMGYTITDYVKSNAIAVRTDLLETDYIPKSIAELYDYGYRNYVDIQPSYNENVKHWLSESPETALKNINEFFRDKSKYTIDIGKFQ